VQEVREREREREKGEERTQWRNKQSCCRSSGGASPPPPWSSCWTRLQRSGGQLSSATNPGGEAETLPKKPITSLPSFGLPSLDSPSVSPRIYLSAFGLAFPPLAWTDFTSQGKGEKMEKEKNSLLLFAKATRITLATFMRIKSSYEILGGVYGGRRLRPRADRPL
jgi:hypothetical protein